LGECQLEENVGTRRISITTLTLTCPFKRSSTKKNVKIQKHFTGATWGRESVLDWKAREKKDRRRGGDQPLEHLAVASIEEGGNKKGGD